MKTAELREKISGYGYQITDEVYNSFLCKLRKLKKESLSQKQFERQKLIEEGFETDEKNASIKEEDKSSVCITQDILHNLIYGLEKYYKPYFSKERLIRLIFAAVLQYQELHCCVLKSKGDNNVAEMSGYRGDFKCPYQILIVTQKGRLKYTNSFGYPPELLKK